ncbi:MAG: replication factor C large subunit [Pyrobaculum arsenaticum]|uniref:Replication factor C large subunit n=2 Tax=Pyrobaculum arsenaticum TaxID=121277 RepID=RFCL_PYRAR|nr:replication factor C large subunit [Pyrobaculum arsenaticum]A4WGV3.1 RecName: Full=Replication factor C large subunit; Short=RFC large subunit; AltName: Full=Clamp loader large subunit [Pyrobaculum arsenaticum DSM 13514]ABP49620.1 AAA ATPase, central domain protein [Pyrobaculum arsenaticum DSM 13514]MCY0891060.1 replication factor C large subunit [Pyrobaculum arsenaticum]NYR15607.1 replication factor C large subunit [Pyrobaculum arsenaticum]
MALPWVEKYRPKSFADVVDQEEAKYVLASWICARFRAPKDFCTRWAKKKDKEILDARAVLLAGPPGVGKTTLIHALAREIGYELIELNASDVRTAERLKEVVGRGLREGSLFGYGGKIVLFDEVDGLHVKEDAGGLEAIIEIIENSKVPIVMTANNPYDPRFRPLRDISLVVNLKRLSEEEVVEVLRRICTSEGAKCEEEALRSIAKSSLGDLRAAINDLQMYLSGGRKTLTVDDIKRVGERNPQLSMFEILDRVYRARWFDEARAISFNPSFDWEQYFIWATETIPVVYKEIETMSVAYDRLSKADMFIGRIKRTQEWELLPYALELALGGVSQIKSKPRLPPFIKYGFPQRLLILAKSREARKRRDVLVEYLAQNLHVSRSYVKSEIIYVLGVLAKSDSKIVERLSKALGINAIDIKTLL